MSGLARLLKNGFLYVLLSLTLLFVSQLFLSGKELRQISLEEVLSVGRLDDDILFQWAGVFADSNGNIYVTDAMDYSLKKFDSQGNFIKKVGRKGQGPGEFMAPRLLDGLNRYLYATDQHRLGVQVFDMELNFKRHIPIKKPIADLKILSDSQIAVATMFMDKMASILIYNADGELTGEFRYSEKKSPLMMDMVSFDFDKDGNLYLAYTFQDRIEKFDRKENRSWSKQLLRINKIKKKKISFYEVPTQVVYKDVAMDSSGHLFVLGGHFSRNRSRDVYVISPGGEHLTTLTLPDTSHCIYIDGKNCLYSRANEGITLKKYRMRYVYE